MTFWKALFGSGPADIPLTVPALDAYLRKQFGREISELVLKSVPDGVQLVRVVFMKGGRIENTPIRTHAELEKLFQQMAMLYDLWLSYEESLGKMFPSTSMPPREVVYLENRCPECVVGAFDSVDDYEWVLSAGQELKCAECGASFPAPHEDMVIRVRQDTSLVAVPRSRKR